MMCARGSRRGITLLEMLIIMGLLSLMAGFVAVTLWTAMRIQQADTALFQNMHRQHALADRFRSDVAAAAAAPTELGILRANPYCLILSLHNGEHVIYHAGDERLERIVLNADFEPTAVSAYEYGDNKRGEFSRSEDGRLYTLQLADVTPRFEQKRSVNLTAALLPEVREKSF